MGVLTEIKKEPDNAGGQTKEDVKNINHLTSVSEVEDENEVLIA